MPTSWKWAIGAGDDSPFIFIDHVDEQIIVKAGKSTIEIFTPNNRSSSDFEGDAMKVAEERGDGGPDRSSVTFR